MLSIKFWQKIQVVNPFTWKEEWANSTPKDFVYRQIQVWNMISSINPIFEISNLTGKISYKKEATNLIRFGAILHLATSSWNMLDLTLKFTTKRNEGCAMFGSYLFQILLWICFSTSAILNTVITDSHQDVVLVVNTLCQKSIKIGLGNWVTMPLKLVMLNCIISAIGVSGLFSLNILMQNWSNMGASRWAVFGLTVFSILRHNVLAGFLMLQVWIASYMAIWKMSKNLIEISNAAGNDYSEIDQIRLYTRLQIVANAINSCVGGLVSFYTTTGVMFTSTMMGTVLVAGNLRESTKSIELFIAGFLATQMLFFLSIGFWFPSMCNKNSNKIKESWRRKRVVAGENKLARRMAKACRDIRLFIGNMEYFKQGTVLKLLNWAAETTASIAIVISHY